MDGKLTDFARLLAPVSEQTFFAETYHRRPLHVPGSPEKVAATFSWPALNDILAMDVWDPSTLQLVLDRQRRRRRSAPPRSGAHLAGCSHIEDCGQEELIIL